MIEVFAEGYPRVPTMLTADPPDHTRYRRLVTKAFTPKVIASMEPAIREITTRLLDACTGQALDRARRGVRRPAAGRGHRPDRSTCQTHGWPTSSAGPTTRSPASARRLDIDGRVAAERGVNEFQHYFAEQLERRRTDPQRRRAHRSAQRPRRQLTTASPTTGRSTWRRCSASSSSCSSPATRRPRRCSPRWFACSPSIPTSGARVQDDPERVDRVVEETLRLATPTQGMFRIVTQRDDARRRRPPRRGAPRRRLRLGQPRRSAVRRPRRVPPGSGQPQGAPRVRQGHPLLPRRSAVPAGRSGRASGARPAGRARSRLSRRQRARATSRASCSAA